MKCFYSRGAGDKYVAYRSDQKKIVAPAIVIVPEMDWRTVDILWELGLKRESTELRYELERMELMQPSPEGGIDG